MIYLEQNKLKRLNKRNKLEAKKTLNTLAKTTTLTYLTI